MRKKKSPLLPGVARSRPAAVRENSGLAGLCVFPSRGTNSSAGLLWEMEHLRGADMMPGSEWVGKKLEGDERADS